MSEMGQPERATQDCVIILFRDELGYRHLRDWSDRDRDGNIKAGVLTAYLTRTSYTLCLD